MRWRLQWGPQLSPRFWRTRAPSSTAFYGDAVALREELRRDAQRDLVRVVGAEVEADGAVEFLRERGREPVGDEFAAQDGGFRIAADHADERKLPRRERAVQD